MYFSFDTRSSRALSGGRGRYASSRGFGSKLLSRFVCKDISRILT